MTFALRFCGPSLIASLLVCSLAHASTGVAANVIWNAPPGCPESKDVNARIAHLVGNERSISPQAFFATATVTRDEAALPWLVQIETKANDNSGQREFRGASCETVADAAALFIALMLAPGLKATAPVADDPVVRRPAEPPAPARKPPSKPVAAPAPQAIEIVAEQVQIKAAPQEFSEAEPAAEQATPKIVVEQVQVKATPRELSQPPPPLPPRRWRARVEVTAASGALPDPSARLGVSVGATMLRRFPRLSIELAVHGTPSQTANPYSDAPWVRVDAQALGGHLAVCFDQVLGMRLFGRACATGGAHRLSSSSDVVAVPGRKETPLGTAGARLSVGCKVAGGTALLLSGGIDNRFGQRIVEVPPHGPAWTTPALVLDVGVGLELGF